MLFSFPLLEADSMYEILKYLSLPLEFACIILLFTLAGYGLYKYMGTSPVLVLVGTFLGMIAGFYHLLKAISKMNQKE